MEKIQKDKSGLALLGLMSSRPKKRGEGALPPYYTPEREQPKKLKGLYSPIYVFSHFVVGVRSGIKKNQGVIKCANFQVA